MKRYRVGGSVRDELLGRPVNDHDWVVVGATPQQLLDAGYLPVGRDFPVFLDPRTREEVALARTERKTAPGYHGFAFHASPEVTLEQDLARRDLTINAMARDDAGTLIDPYGGRNDLDARVLRHVSPAFAEDPVRLLRVARFAARFTDFTLAPETLALMRTMVDAGEVDALVPERVWQELARGLMEARPSRLFDILRECGALARVLPELDHLWELPWPGAASPWASRGARLLHVLDTSAELGVPLPVRYAAFGPALADTVDHPALDRLGERLRAPADCRELATLTARERSAVHASAALDAPGLVALFDRCDAWRRGARFELLLSACCCDARAESGGQPTHDLPVERLHQALQAAQGVDGGSVTARAAAAGLQGRAIGEALTVARVAAVAAALGGR